MDRHDAPNAGTTMDAHPRRCDYTANPADRRQVGTVAGLPLFALFDDYTRCARAHSPDSATGYIGSRLLREIEAGGCNRRLNERGLEAMTTAGPGHHYPPRRRLTVSYAGHPMGWLFRADTGAWARHERIDARRAIARRALSRS